MITCPNPGIHRDVPAETYHEWDAISASKLKKLADCPAMLKYEMDHPQTQTDAMRIGSAVHDAILLPDRFAAKYVESPKCDKRTTAGKEAWAAFIAEHAGKQVLDADDMAICKGIRESLLADETARGLLVGRGGNEVSIVWDHKATGLRCKSRIDRATEYQGTSCHVDIKTTTDANPDAFRWEVRKYRYHLQAAFYLDGCEALRGGKRRFIFIAVEKMPPYLCSVCELDEDGNSISIQAGRDLYRPLLEKYQTCRESGVWPSYGGIHPLTIGAIQ